MGLAEWIIDDTGLLRHLSNLLTDFDRDNNLKIQDTRW